MYESFFGLSRRPFLPIPDVRAYFASESMESARQMVMQTLERGTGIALIFGQTGTGKSLLLRMLEKRFEAKANVIYVANPRIRTPKALFQHLLFGLHQSFFGAEENELRLMLLDHLRQNESLRIILLIDESQNLSRAVLEELRLLMHCDDGEISKIRVVLAGNQQFEEHLTHPHLMAFQQRVTVRAYLEKFRWNETPDEIIWQLKLAGHMQPESIFTPEARKTVHQITEGVPRLVHQLCDQALVLAATQQKKIIHETFIQNAWGLLQQLPDNKPLAPTNENAMPHWTEIESENKKSPNQPVVQQLSSLAGSQTAHWEDDTIEFGTLDDEISNDEITWDNQELQEEKLVPFEGKSQTPSLVEKQCELETPSTWELGVSQLISPAIPQLNEAATQKRQSCQQLLNELAVMEKLLSKEISVIHNMKKIESDCLSSQRIRIVDDTPVFARFPDKQR